MDGCVCAMLSNDAYPALCLAAAEASAELLVSHSSSFVWAVKVCTNHISHLWSAKISSLPSRFKVRNRELELWFLHQLGDFLPFKTLQIGVIFQSNSDFSKLTGSHFHTLTLIWETVWKSSKNTSNFKEKRAFFEDVNCLFLREELKSFVPTFLCHMLYNFRMVLILRLLFASLLTPWRVFLQLIIWWKIVFLAAIKNTFPLKASGSFPGRKTKKWSNNCFRPFSLKSPPGKSNGKWDERVSISGNLGKKWIENHYC